MEYLRNSLNQCLLFDFVAKIVCCEWWITLYLVLKEKSGNRGRKIEFNTLFSYSISSVLAAWKEWHFFKVYYNHSFFEIVSKAISSIAWHFVLPLLFLIFHSLVFDWQFFNYYQALEKWSFMIKKRCSSAPLF